MQKMLTLELKDNVIQSDNKDTSETVCLTLKSWIQESGLYCACCQKNSEEEPCRWCYKAEGWHLCEHSHDNYTRYFFRPGTLHAKDNDVEVVIYQMLDRAENSADILSCLENLRKTNALVTRS